MNDEQKLWLALATAGIALVGVIITAIMNRLAGQEQSILKTTTDQRLAANKTYADGQLELIRADTQTKLASMKEQHDISLASFNASIQDLRDQRLERQSAEKVIQKYRDPLGHATYDLQSRIFNISQRSFLNQFYAQGTPREQAYAIENTIFVIAQFLCWTEIVRQELQFLDLGSQRQSKDLRALQDSIYSLLQTDSFGKSLRLFAGEQRAVGELMIERTTGHARCIGFATFVTNRPPSIDLWLNPLRDDLRQMASNPTPSSCLRLRPLQHSLIDMLEFLDPTDLMFPFKKRSKI